MKRAFMFLLIALVSINLFSCHRKTVNTKDVIAHIQQSGLVDLQLSRQPDLKPLKLAYCLKSDGDSVNQYLKAVELYDEKHIYSKDSEKYNLDAVEFDYLTKGAEYKDFDIQKYVSGAGERSFQFSIGTPFILLSKGLSLKGDQYLIEKQPEKALLCYEAGLVMGQRFSDPKIEGTGYYVIGVAMSRNFTEKIIQYYKTRNDLEKVKTYQEYYAVVDKLHQKYRNKQEILLPKEYAYKKTFRVDTTKLPLLIEIALFDESSVYRIGAISSLGVCRYFGKERSPYGDINWKEYIDIVLNDIQENDKDPLIKMEAEKSLLVKKADAEISTRMYSFIEQSFSKASVADTQNK